jgi:transposase
MDAPFSADCRPKAVEPHTKEPIVSKDITFMGLDVHKRSIAVAVREADSPVQEEQLPNERAAVARWARRWKRRSGGNLQVAYEAGACGYALQRQLEGLGVACQVVAPSLVPRRPGERIKTDRRDACKLAEYLQGGHLTPVHPPTPAQEAARDVCRAREDAKQDRMRCRHRLSKFLLRGGRAYTPGRKHWTDAHRSWLAKLSFDESAAQVVFDDYRLAVAQLDARIDALDRQIEALAQQAPYQEAVSALRCFRGIDTRTAFGLVTELHSIQHFDRPGRLMAFVGLVPSEASSGERQRRGAITKAGNGHARKLLIEAAWHARHKPAIPVALRKRRAGQPPEVIAMADVAQQRLHRRYWRLVQRGKPTTVAVTAVARELTGFVWAALRAVT